MLTERVEGCVHQSLSPDFNLPKSTKYPTKEDEQAYLSSIDIFHKWNNLAINLGRLTGIITNNPLRTQLQGESSIALR